MANELTIYQSVIDDVKGIISSGMESAYNATSRAMVLTYWNVRMLDRNISTQYYYRLLQSPKYDALKRTAGDNPTIGILLCSETDEDIARYSVLHDSDRLFMSKYLTYLPTKEQLKQEIERQKAVFYMKHPLQIEEGGE